MADFDVQNKEFDKRLRDANLGISFLFPIAVGLSSVLFQYFFTDYLDNMPVWALLVICGLCAFMVAAIVLRRFMGSKLEFILFSSMVFVAAFCIGFAFPFPSPYFPYIVFIVLMGFQKFGHKGSLSILIGYFGLFLVRMAVDGNIGDFHKMTEFVVLYLAVMVASVYAIVYLHLAQDEKTAFEGTLQKIAFERERLTSLINNLDDGVIACDRDFRIILNNPKAETILNTEETLAGKPLDSFLKLSDDNGKQYLLRELIDAHNYFADLNNYRLQHKDGSFINLNIAVANVRLTSKDSESGYVLLLRDITKTKSPEVASTTWSEIR